MQIIGHIHTAFKSKFGIPRQSGLIDELKGRIVFEPEYRQKEAFRGLEEYSHIWILWKFSEAKREKWSATVTPPRLGGKERMGVFATRSPFRPNDIGLSCVKLEKVILDGEDGPEILVSGVDMLDNTPIYDIKPYIAYTDCVPDANSGFAERTIQQDLKVMIDEGVVDALDGDTKRAVIKIVEQDPRPAYDKDETKSYGVLYMDYDIRFKVCEEIARIYEIVNVKEHPDTPRCK